MRNSPGVHMGTENEGKLGPFLTPPVVRCIALRELLLAVTTQCPCPTLCHKVDVKVQDMLKREQTFKSPPDHPLIVPHLLRHFIVSVRQNEGGLVFQPEALSVLALMRGEGDSLHLVPPVCSMAAY